MNKLLDYFGFVKDKEIDVTYPDDFACTDSLDLKLDYLKALDTQENARQSTVEAKTSQIIGQAGIIFSLLSLFIANYIPKFNSFPSWVQATLISLFVFTLFFYMVTIFQATKYMNIHKYVYGQRSVTTVLAKFDDDADFKREEIKDLMYSIERNTAVNNQKCNNLIYAYRSFTSGTIAVGFLSIFLISSGYFLPKPETAKVNIEQPVTIRGLDTALNKFIKRPAIIIHDTIYVKK